MPVGLVVDNANVHDIRLLQETIENCLERVPRLSGPHGEHLCLDKGYDSVAIRELVQAVFGYTAHIRFEAKNNESSRNRVVSGHDAGWSSELMDGSIDSVPS